MPTNILIDPTSPAEQEATNALRNAWQAIQAIKPRKGWPPGGPTLPQRLGEHISHYRTPQGLVYRCEPYGPFGSKEIQLLCDMLDEWDICIDPRGSTHHPGGTAQLLFRKLG